MNKISGFTLIILLTILFFPFVSLSKVEEIKIITNAHCQGCKTKIEKALKKVNGVIEASLDLPSKVANVKFDSEKTTVEKLIQSVRKVGYEAEIFEEGKNYDLPEHKDVDCQGKKSDPKCKDKKTEQKTN